MALSIDILDLGDVGLDSSFLVQFRSPGTKTWVRTVGYLIKGHPEGLILVDTGFRSTEIMRRIGMVGRYNEGRSMETELEKRGLKFSDVRYVMHTHLHMDHAGKTDLFPLDTTTVILNRRELEIAAGSGLVGYPPEDTKHLIDRLYQPGAAMLLDLKESGPVEVLEGIVCELAGGHTEGSMNIAVQTAEGSAYICGDVFYDVQDQFLDPAYHLLAKEPKLSGHFYVSWLQEKGAMKKALYAGDWLLPMHDAPVKVEKGGRIVGRVWGNQVPGEVTPIEGKGTPTDLEVGTVFR
ncbi:MAG: MBL fold metallo-hydrolase [Roseiflexaceae bacterium]|nr:MBL fold metallo-hydrolase [Roseiflexaceae bacterium]